MSSSSSSSEDSLSPIRDGGYYSGDDSFVEQDLGYPLDDKDQRLDELWMEFSMYMNTWNELIIPLTTTDRIQNSLKENRILLFTNHKLKEILCEIERIKATIH